LFIFSELGPRRASRRPSQCAGPGSRASWLCGHAPQVAPRLGSGCARCTGPEGRPSRVRLGRRICRFAGHTSITRMNVQGGLWSHNVGARGAQGSLQTSIRAILMVPCRIERGPFDVWVRGCGRAAADQRTGR
jgi:hypothetical protein